MLQLYHFFWKPANCVAVKNNYSVCSSLQEPDITWRELANDTISLYWRVRATRGEWLTGIQGDYSRNISHFLRAYSSVIPGKLKILVPSISVAISDCATPHSYSLHYGGQTNSSLFRSSAYSRKLVQLSPNKTQRFSGPKSAERWLGQDARVLRLSQIAKHQVLHRIGLLLHRS